MPRGNGRRKGKRREKLYKDPWEKASSKTKPLKKKATKRRRK